MLWPTGIFWSSMCWIVAWNDYTLVSALRSDFGDRASIIALRGAGGDTLSTRLISWKRGEAALQNLGLLKRAVVLSDILGVCVHWSVFAACSEI
ncbi:hypothetical protein SERLA73DRAFT_184699 [Serpula lacrymans var. lacrymans S7.3]|uniref:Uncharacterized protein n=2 Tax=Serpula lacrymans var. lacrymans TaxID=341189 RepID=F8Q4Y0_SERL3|nr:uncharacterized protein SERLADRAFT_472620 [Serpula lacrymans var. lacrymans S7.9]EGN96607.1 hypothetical protein SERLA73DRAFT_184699 [Serpula lacrymans var. lacrymans S7.3]EGO22176.1 hypothetical protein SERLADRAFT_472620 [Serpula lacrymans var. lacrymans S7.9]